MTLYLGLCQLALAAEQSPTEWSSWQSRELGEDDIRAITLKVLETHPLLSSSSGVKSAVEYRGLGRGSADVIFYPHLESNGIKQAYQAHCLREDGNQDWSCPAVEIRRYLKLDSQDFEVRVKGNANRETILAVIEATRATALSYVEEKGRTCDTAIMVYPLADHRLGDHYSVSWGTREGYGFVGVQAWLKDGGDSTEPGDWKARIEPPVE